MITSPTPVRLSAHPYLLAAVLHAAVSHGRDPGALAQKAHRLINKLDYKHTTLDRTAQAAFGTDWRALLGEETDSIFFNSVMDIVVCADCGASEDAISIMEALDRKDANFGHLRDFINHVLSGDE